MKMVPKDLSYKWKIRPQLWQLLPCDLVVACLQSCHLLQKHRPLLKMLSSLDMHSDVFVLATAFFFPQEEGRGGPALTMPNLQCLQTVWFLLTQQKKTEESFRLSHSYLTVRYSLFLPWSSPVKRNIMLPELLNAAICSPANPICGLGLDRLCTVCNFHSTTL